MTHVLLTGASGFLGRAVAKRLCERLASGAVRSLTLVDQVPFTDGCEPYADLPALARERVHQVVGDLGDPAILELAVARKPDQVFHLAGVTSRQAEDEFALGLAVNVDASMSLFERLREQGRRPVLVYASSCAVYGPPLPSLVDDTTVPAPRLSYGSQKLMIEILLADYSRRGWLDARALRLPSVVARPTSRSAAASSFASDLIREPSLGHPYVCPVGPDASLWWLSLSACVEHLLHAAQLAAAQLPRSRAWNLPALRASVADVVEALSRRLDREPAALVIYQPQAAMQAQFAQWPPLTSAIAQGLGFAHDGNLDQLLERALADLPISDPVQPVH